LSTRARITATSFANSYEWGDFKGDPAKLMERWFDIHLYLANWGTRRLMIRLPKRLVDRRVLDRFLGEIDCAKVRVAGENLILDIWLESKKRLPDYMEQKPANTELRSQYALRLYSWAKKYVEAETKSISLEELRKVLGLDSIKDADGNVIQEPPLPIWANFRQRAFDVAIMEVN
jgi:hypothetical protein